MNANDFALSAQACLPIINGILGAIKNKTHPMQCFLNIDLPTDIANHKVSLVAAFNRHSLMPTPNYTSEFYMTDSSFQIKRDTN